MEAEILVVKKSDFLNTALNIKSETRAYLVETINRVDPKTGDFEDSKTSSAQAKVEKTYIATTEYKIIAEMKSPEFDSVFSQSETFSYLVQGAINQLNRDFHQQLYNHYRQLGDTKKVDPRNGWQRLVSRVFPKLNFYNYWINEFNDSALNKIFLLECSKVALLARRPVPSSDQFFIVSAGVAADIQSSIAFKPYLENVEHVGIISIGTFYDKQVFVNPIISFNDNTVVLGTITRAKQSGVAIVRHSESVITETHIGVLVQSEHGIATVGSEDTIGFKTFTFEMSKKPLFRKLLGL